MYQSAAMISAQETGQPYRDISRSGEPMIRVHLERLAKAVGEHGEFLAQLEQKLGDVTAPEPPCKLAGQATRDAVPVSRIAEQLDAIVAQVGSATSRLRSLMERLEL